MTKIIEAFKNTAPYYDLLDRFDRYNRICFSSEKQYSVNSATLSDIINYRSSGIAKDLLNLRKMGIMKEYGDTKPKSYTINKGWSKILEDEFNILVEYQAKRRVETINLDIERAKSPNRKPKPSFMEQAKKNQLLVNPVLKIDLLLKKVRA